MSGEAIHHQKDPAARWADPEPQWKPPGYVPPKPTAIDEMLAGKKSPNEVANTIIDEAYGPLKQYCALPAGFADRMLEYECRGVAQMTVEQVDELNASPPVQIIDPHEAQIKAIELFEMYLQGHPMVCENRDPFQPRFGANLVGPPGCGKTHILSVFARRMKEYHDGKLEQYRTMVTQFVCREYVAYQRAIARVKNPSDPASVWKLGGTPAGDEAALLDQLSLGKAGAEGSKKRPSLQEMARLVQGSIVEQKHPATVFLEKLEQFKSALSKLQYQPPDLLYLDFETLWELCRSDSATREQALDAIIRAKVMFLDDLHPKGDVERVQIVLHVIEGRYTAGRMGTFITTNLTTEELAGKDARIVDRLQSRCSEMFYEIDFKGCVDWRVQVKRRRITLVEDYLNQRIAGRENAGPAG